MAYGIWKQPNDDPDFYVVKDPTSGGLSPQERIAKANNDTFYANNGSHRPCQYAPGGHTYSSGKSW